MRSVFPKLYSGDPRKKMSNHRQQRSVLATLDQVNTPSSVDPNVMGMVEAVVSKKNEKSVLSMANVDNLTSCDEKRSDSRVKVSSDLNCDFKIGFFFQFKEIVIFSTGCSEDSASE